MKKNILSLTIGLVLLNSFTVVYAASADIFALPDEEGLTPPPEEVVVVDNEQILIGQKLEREQLERERMQEQKALEREQKLEQERLEREKQLEQEELERYRIRAQEELAREKQLEQEELEREQKLEQERFELEKQLEQEELAREQKLEQERLEQENQRAEEKKLEQEALAREQKREQEQLEKEKKLEKEALAREQKLEKVRLAQEKKLEKEALVREQKLEKERLIQEKKLEKEALAREHLLEKELLAQEKKLEQEALAREQKLEQERLEQENRLAQQEQNQNPVVVNTGGATKERLRGLSKQNFKELPPTAMAELDADIIKEFEPEVIQLLRPEHFKYFKPEQFEQIEYEDLLKIVINSDPTHISPENFQGLLPKSWVIASDGSIDLPEGEKIALPAMPKFNALPEEIELSKEIPDLSKGFGLGGQGKSILGALNAVLDEAGLVDFNIKQDKTGILQVEGINQYTGVNLSFIPDVDHMKQAKKGLPSSVSKDARGLYVLTTRDGIEVPVRPAPKDLGKIKAVMPQKSSKIKMGKAGDVFFQLPHQGNDAAKYGASIFSPEVIAAPKGLEPGVYFVDAFKNRHSGIVVYDDGTAQRMKATVLSPQTFIEKAEEFDGVTDPMLNADGSVGLFYNGHALKLQPTFDVSMEGSVQDAEPSITLQEGGVLEYRYPVSSYQAAVFKVMIQ